MNARILAILAREAARQYISRHQYAYVGLSPETVDGSVVIPEMESLPCCKTAGKGTELTPVEWVSHRRTVQHVAREHKVKAADVISMIPVELLSAAPLATASIPFEMLVKIRDNANGTADSD